MLKTKKMLSLLLAAVFAIAMMVPTAFAAQFSDVPESYRYYEAVENLAARGIIDGMGDGTFAPDANVKRDEFAKIVCIGLMSTGEVAPAAGAGFTDVADDRWSSGYIKVAAAAGIINGMGDGTFAPEDPVTYEQAIKMLVCALGYDIQAQQRGGYPSGYLSMAGVLGLLKGVSDGAVGQAANRGLIAKLVDNSLTIEIFDPITGTTSGSVSERDDQQSVKGQVVSVYGATIYAGETSSCGKKQIEIQKGNDRVIYSIDSLNISNINDYLGRMVTAYYKDEAGADYYEITNLSLQKGRNTTTQIDLNSIETYSNTEIEYLPSVDDDYETASIDSGAIVMYNGVATTTSLSKLLDNNLQKSGEITLLDTAGSGSASIVFLKTYDTYVVSQIDKNNYKIYDKMGVYQPKTLDETDRTKTITFTRDGSASEFSKIAVGDIVSVSESSDGNIIDVLISTKEAKGTITEISNDKMTLTLDRNKEYKVAKSYQSEAEKNFALDVYVTVYLDSFGKIAFADVGSTSGTSTYTYAYLTGAEKKSSTSDEVSIRFYDIKGSSSLTSRTVALSENGVKINGETYTNADDILERLATSAAELNQGEAATGAGEYTQIIKYSTRGAYIDKIITYQEGQYDQGNENVLSVDNVAAEELKATASNKLGKYTISSSSKTVVIPENRISGKYTGRNYNSYEVDRGYKAQIFDASKTNIPQVVLIYGISDAEVNMKGIEPVIVTSVSGSKEVSGFDSPVSVLKVKDMNGNEREYYSDGTEEFSKLSSEVNGSLDSGEKFGGIVPGDIVKVSVDGQSQIDEIMLIARAADVVSGAQGAYYYGEGNDADTPNAEHRFYLGTVRVKDTVSGNTMVVTPKYVDDADFSDESLDETYSDVPDNILVIDTQTTNENRRVDSAMFGDINAAVDGEASKIFMYTSYNKIKMLVIFR